jgi:hypothetical protein
MSWNNEEYAPEFPLPVEKSITSPKQNVNALAEAIPKGEFSTKRKNGTKVELNPNVEKHILSYLAPKNVRITPVTNTPKKLSTYLNFKNQLTKKNMRNRLIANSRMRQQNQVNNNYRIFAERRADALLHERRMLNLNNEEANNSDNNNYIIPANPNLIDGGKKTRRNKSRRSNKSRRNYK